MWSSFANAGCAHLEQSLVLLLGPRALAQVEVLRVQEVVLDLLPVAPAQLRRDRLQSAHNNLALGFKGVSTSGEVTAERFLLRARLQELC